MDIQGQAKLALDAHLSATLARTGELEGKAIGGGKENDEGEQVVASGFEELLSRMLVTELRKSVPEGMFGGGSGSDVYASWFDEHISKVLAEQRAFGIGAMVETSLGDISPEEMAVRDLEEEGQ